MKKITKKLIIVFFILILFTIYLYVCAIDAIPTSAILFEGEKLNSKTLFGMSLKYKSNKNLSNLLETSVASIPESKKNNIIEVSLFDTFKVKEINVDTIKRATVIPVGTVSGLKLYTNGVLIVGMTEIKGLDNKKYKPYEKTNLEEGDIITKVDDIVITDTDKLIETINKSEGKSVKIKYLKNEQEQVCEITPAKTGKDEYKLGLWVRDSAAGIGTLSFYEPSTGNFAALGHGITDIDTGELLDISDGEFITTKVVSIIKGKEGTPGKIQGSIEDQTQIGTIYKNTNYGVYGKITDVLGSHIDLTKEMPVALRDEIKLGDAKILCSLDENEPKEYSIKIEKIFLNNDFDNKSMLIKVTDKELLEKTGGIIQGMSGSPIIQNEKFIGAVTNVLINDPTKGYAIFGDMMVKIGDR